MIRIQNIQYMLAYVFQCCRQCWDAAEESDTANPPRRDTGAGVSLQPARSAGECRSAKRRLSPRGQSPRRPRSPCAGSWSVARRVQHGHAHEPHPQATIVLLVRLDIDKVRKKAPGAATVLVRDVGDGPRT